MDGKSKGRRTPAGALRGTRAQAAVILACALFALVTVTVVTLFVVGYCMLLAARNGQPVHQLAAMVQMDAPLLLRRL